MKLLSEIQQKLRFLKTSLSYKTRYEIKIIPKEDSACLKSPKEDSACLKSFKHSTNLNNHPVNYIERAPVYMFVADLTRRLVVGALQATLKSTAALIHS